MDAIHVPLSSRNSSVLSTMILSLSHQGNSSWHISPPHCTDSCVSGPPAGRPFVGTLLLTGRASSAQHLCSRASQTTPSRGSGSLCVIAGKVPLTDNRRDGKSAGGRVKQTWTISAFLPCELSCFSSVSLKSLICKMESS